jgi:transcriptional repressor NrdR
MRCPYCRIDNDRVIDSRVSQDGFAIRRRRECSHCKKRFTTYERLEEMGIKVVKKNSIREPFDREKVRSGLAKACWKRPVSDEQIEQIVSLVESDVYATGEGEIDSHQLGEMVMQRLAAVDQVASSASPACIGVFRTCATLWMSCSRCCGRMRGGRNRGKGQQHDRTISRTTSRDFA